ncbi:hypothetical protein BDN70DRAFT_241919 [Pholiota conissans]|uniref:Uncharacterized protein n=1 Tax=Pholiota conissans TaxID=109636 RepID=A0A9P6CY93_9AGAR|nr:hypothetical protein BDN70DRAFT_241919 [Pholiota conissans]
MGPEENGLGHNYPCNNGPRFRCVHGSELPGNAPTLSPPSSNANSTHITSTSLSVTGQLTVPVPSTPALTSIMLPGTPSTSMPVPPMTIPAASLSTVLGTTPAPLPETSTNNLAGQSMTLNGIGIIAQSDLSSSESISSVFSTTAVSTSGTGSMQAVQNNSSSHNHKNTGKIVGGVIGGIAALILLILATHHIWRRRQTKRTPPSAEFMAGRTNPLSGGSRLLHQCLGTSGFSNRVADDVTFPVMRERISNPFSPPTQTVALPY